MNSRFINAMEMIDFQNENLTRNFKRKEFACRGEACCARSAPVSQKLVDAMQFIRSSLNVKIRINSGYSCQLHNAIVGRDITSDHAEGLAADATILSDMPMDDVFDVVKTIQGVRYFCMYDTHFHISMKRLPSDEFSWEDKRTEA